MRRQRNFFWFVAQKNQKKREKKRKEKKRKRKQEEEKKKKKEKGRRGDNRKSTEANEKKGRKPSSQFSLSFSLLFSSYLSFLSFFFSCYEKRSRFPDQSNRFHRNLSESKNSAIRRTVSQKPKRRLPEIKLPLCRGLLRILVDIITLITACQNNRIYLAPTPINPEPRNRRKQVSSNNKTYVFHIQISGHESLVFANYLVLTTA